MFLSDFADFFIKTGSEGKGDGLLTEPTTPCLLRPGGHPSSELANVFVVEIKEGGAVTHCMNGVLLCGHRPCSTLVNIFVDCR